jgi:hypothetical protein
MHKHFFNYCIVFFLFVGCTVKPVPASKNEQARLAHLLQTVDNGVSYKESIKLSRDIFKQTYTLTKNFQLSSPPLWHNFLVNIGLREKGLCYHWSDALYIYLQHKNYKLFSFYLVGANIGEYFFEHNALVVVKKKAKNIQGGIVIDPWRDSSKLYFERVEEDESYIWKHRRERELPSLE